MISRGLLRDNPSLSILVKRLADLAAVLLGGWAASLMRHGDWHLGDGVRELVLVAMVATSFLFDQVGLYRSQRGGRLLRELEALTGAWTAVVGALAIYVWLTGYHPRAEANWMALWFTLSLAGMSAVRVLATLALNALRRRGYNRRSVVIVVASDLGRQVGERLAAKPQLGFEVQGYFDDREPQRVGALAGGQLLGRIDELAAYVQRHKIDQVWVTLPFRAEDRIRDILHALRHSTADVRLVPDVFQFFMLNQSVDDVAGLPVLTLTASPMQGMNRLIKAAEDRLLAAIILMLISPILAVVAVAVKLSSPGPVFFAQNRHGWNGQTFKVWKFRTMKVHQEAPGKVTLATKGDPRITPVGGFLRRTSLDELPQFFNVLMGQMSIVGPRPHPIEINDEYKDTVDRYMLRHKVKPGITGWAQVNGLRGALDTPDKMLRRVQHDLYYIEHWSVWFDLRIVVLTIFKGFIHENAY